MEVATGAEGCGVWKGGIPLPTGGRVPGRGLCPLLRKFFVLFVENTIF